MLRATPAERVTADLFQAASGRPLHPRLRGALDDPPGMLSAITDTLYEYWAW